MIWDCLLKVTPKLRMVAGNYFCGCIAEIQRILEA